MFGRSKPAQTQTQQILDELSESYGHFKQAAGHVAGGAAEKLTPPYDKARNTAARGWYSTKDAFRPVYEQVKVGAANARKETDVSGSNNKKRWPMLAGLLAAGAAVGAAGALVARRRRAAQWEEFESTSADSAFGLDEAQDEAARPSESTKDRTSSPTHKVTAGAAAVAETVSTQAGKIAETLHEKSGDTAKQMGEKAGDVTARAEDTVGDTARKARESTGKLAEEAAKKSSEAGKKPSEGGKGVEKGASAFSDFAEDSAEARANASKNTRS